LTVQVTWIDALKALTFTINYFSGNRFIHHVWSLCVEEHSYIVLALVAWIVRHWKLNALNICLCLALACIINGLLQSFLLKEYSYYVVYWRTDVRAGSIFLAVSAYLYFRDKTVPGWLPIVCGLAGMMFQVNFLPDFIKYSIGSALLAISIATLGKTKEWLLLILGNRILTIAGTFSYSIYLWQQPFYKSGGLRLLPLALICAVLSFYLIEKPARRFIVSFRWFGSSRI
jgi:peptidoglycan/LPS O-acetylase OafA/YrhL